MAGVARGAARAVVAWLTPVAVVLGLLAAVAARFGDRATVSVLQCVPGEGLARFGVSLALLRPDDGCARGELALGGNHRQVVVVAVAVALPALVAHLAGALAGAGLLARLHRLIRAALGMLIPALRAPEVAAPAAPSTVPVAAPAERPVERVVVGAPQRRGPPQVRFA